MTSKKDKIADSIKNSNTEEQKKQSITVEKMKDKSSENPNIDNQELSNIENDTVDISNGEIDSDTTKLNNSNIEESNMNDKEMDIEKSSKENSNDDSIEEKLEVEENAEVSYTVVHSFRDLEDKSSENPNGYIYRINDLFPREGFLVKEKRIQELMSTNNKIGKVLIEVKK